MKIPQLLKWALRQMLGTKRGELVIDLLSGPLGVMIDVALKGQVSASLDKLDAATDDVRYVLGAKSRAVAAGKE